MFESGFQGGAVAEATVLGEPMVLSSLQDTLCPFSRWLFLLQTTGAVRAGPVSFPLCISQSHTPKNVLDGL